MYHMNEYRLFSFSRKYNVDYILMIQLFVDVFYCLQVANDIKKRLTLTGTELPTALPHCFYVHSYRSPTKCHICKRLLKGLVKQGYRCKGILEKFIKNFIEILLLDCKMSVHKKCIPSVTNNCRGMSIQNSIQGKKRQE